MSSKYQNTGKNTIIEEQILPPLYEIYFFLIKNGFTKDILDELYFIEAYAYYCHAVNEKRQDEFTLLSPHMKEGTKFEKPFYIK